MRRPRLFWRIYATYLVVVFVAVAAVGLLAYDAARTMYLENTEQDLVARAALARETLAPLLNERDMDQLEPVVQQLAAAAHTRFTVVAGAFPGVALGTVIGESERLPGELANHRDRPEIIAALRGEIGRTIRLSSTLGKQEMYVAVPVERDDAVVAVVRAAMPLAVIGDALPALSWRIAAIAALIALLAALVGLIVSSGISRQMRALRDGAGRFAAGDFSSKLSVPRTAEFAAVAESLNTMSEHLDDEIRTLTRERNEREAILAGMVEGVVAVDTDERVLTLNGAAADLLGVDRAAAIGRSIQQVVRNPDLQRIVTQALDGEGPVERVVRLRVGGAERVLRAEAALLRGEDDDHPAGAVVVLNDVTRLERLEAVRRDFVANVSHELKTPVTSIKGFAETLLEGAADDPATRERFLRIIASQSERLMAIVSDLLALSRLEADEAAQTPLETGDLCEVVDGAVEICAIAAHAKGITLAVGCGDVAPALINAPLLEQAVVNLIDNAIKYSPEGSTVTVELAETDDEVAILVRDQGPGIAREHIPRLFERFYRVDSARSRDLGGTGLGLAIVKHVAQVHGGHVSVASEVGRGSTFRLSLPGRPAGGPTLTESSPKPDRHLTNP